MIRGVFRLPVWIVSAVFIVSIPLHCQADENPELQELIDELRTLAEKSRDQRAADRWLQQALEDLVSKYDWPWRRELLFDDFSDGNFAADPEWTVICGKFWIDASLGLRSSVQPKRRAAPEESARERSEDSTKDLGRAVFGELLDQAFKRDELRRESESRSKRDVSREGPARIRLGTLVTNAFSLELAFSVHNEPGVEGHFEIALFQEQAGDYGYLLAIHTGEEGIIDLYRLRRGQRELVNSSELKAGPGIGERHELVWRQADNGQVEVFMNGEETMNLRDKAFRDDYRWLELVNRSGELGIRRVRILGTPE
jgi:hypothetical protein